MRNLLSVMLGVSAVLLSNNPVAAQTGNGSIQGTVQDQSGAIIPGAKVVIEQIATARSYELISNAAGLYRMPSLPPGNYRIGVDSPGLALWRGELLLQRALDRAERSALRRYGSVILPGIGVFPLRRCQGPAYAGIGWFGSALIGPPGMGLFGSLPSTLSRPRS